MNNDINEKKSKHSLGMKLSVIAVAAGAALLLLGGIGSLERREAGSANSASPVQIPSAAEYERELEQRITELCRGVLGDAEIHVMVSLKGGYKTVYAMDAQSSSGGYRSEIVKVGSGSNQEGIVIGYENPEISGVGIVCEGGDDARVKSNIVSLVSAALNVSTNKVFVAASR